VKGDDGLVAGQPALGFAGLLRQLRTEASLTQEELAEAATLSVRSISDLERGINRTARKDTAELLAAALGLAGSAGALFVAAARGRAPAAEVLAVLRGDAARPGCPYLGLVPFEERDARVFFGRGELVDQLLRRLAGQRDAPGILLVAGESGAGKSSLLRAGLMPRLAAGALGPGSQRWPRRVIRPAGNPLRELAMQLADISGVDPVSVYGSLSAAPGEAPMLAEQAVRTAAGHVADPGPGVPADAVAAGPPRLILIVDQFEELFAAGEEADADRAEREAFIVALHAAATVRVGPHKLPSAQVVAAVRADFLGRLIAYPPLKAALDAGPFTVGPMSEAELRLAITGPAAEADLAVEPALIEAAIAELRAGADGGLGSGGLGSGVLPLISQAMAATWEHREGSELTLRAYRRAGGVADAVNRGAQTAYDALTSRQKDAARLVFTQLATITADGQLARRRCRRTELYSPAMEMTADIDAVIDIFSAHRLLVLGTDGIEISHDVLLQTWKQLRDWLGDDQLDRALYSQVVSDADAWQASGRDSSYLYRPGRLATIDAATSRWQDAPARYLPLPATGQAFLRAAHHAARRVSRRRTTAIIVLSLLLTLAMVAGGTALVFQRQAEAQRDAARAQLISAEASLLRTTDPNLATQLSIVAYQADPESGVNALLASQGSPGRLDDGEPALDMAQQDDGSVVAVSTGTAIRLLNALTGQPSAQIAGLATGPVVIVPAARVLVGATGPLGSLYPITPYVSSESGLQEVRDQIRIWSIADPAHPRLLAAVPARATDVVALAVSPDGRTLAAASLDGGIRIWDIAEPGRPALLSTLPGDGKAVYSLAFDPRGSVLASAGDDHMIRLWDLSQPAHPAPLSRLSASTGGPDPADPAMPHRVAFSADGTYLAGVAGTDSAEYPDVWKVSDPRAPRPYADGASAPSVCDQVVMGLAFMPQGGELLSSCYEGQGVPSSLDVWQFQPNGTTGAEELRNVTTLPDSSGGAGTGGQVLAEAGRDVALDVTPVGVTEWYLNDDVEPGALASVPASTEIAAGSLALNSSGRPLMADTASLGFVRLWSLSDDPAHPPHATVYADASPRTTGAEIDALADGVALSGNGTILAASEVESNRPEVVLYRTAKPGSAPVATIRSLSDGAVALALSGTGNLLAVSDNTDYKPAQVRPPTVRLYDLKDPSHPRLIASLPGNTFHVMFSPDDRMLVAFTGDTLLAWDISDPSRPVELPEQHLSPASAFSAGAFSPAGTLLAAEDSQGVLWLWHVTDDRLTGQAILQNQDEGGTSSAALAFSPDGQTLAVAGQLAANIGDQAIELWDVANPGAPRLEAQWAQPNDDDIDALGFSPVGQVLVAEGEHDINLWSTNPTQIVQNLCASVGDTVTPAQWREYIPGLPYRPPCDRGTAGSH
jgi:WD40 repeat protein/transcriptional regulator with XRE-family HTH domain